jgi:hypothetical protein
MRALLLLALAAAAAGACQAPTQHTGKRPIATRRTRGLGPDKTLDERLAERAKAMDRAAPQEGRDVAADEQFVGVGSTHLFHDPGCRLLADVPRSDRVLFVSSFDALDGGYAPCTTCRPGR